MESTGSGCRRSNWTQVLASLIGIVLAVMSTRTASAQASGACCLPNGTCVFLTAVCECDVQGGQFFLIQPCSSVNCNTVATAFGACCLPSGGCVYTNPGNCQTANGSFLQGTPCNVAATCPSAPAQGCCCGTVCYMTDPFYCQRVGGVVQAGPCTATLCNPAPIGACCDTAGQCTLTLQAQCPVPPNVSWTPASACLPGQCLPPGAGACCGPNGCVIIFNPCECIAKLGGPFFFGQTCNPDPCPPASPLGSCCIPSTVAGQFTCTTTSVTVCSQLNGIFTGNGGCNVPGGNCVPAAAACCCPITNTCHWIDPAQCALIGGTSGPVGVMCTPLTCAQPGSGACCNPATGICTIEPDPSHCPPPSVFYPGVTCANISCNPSFGACCNTTTGNCFVGPVTQCVGPNFVWIAGANCLPNPCPTSGACCTPCTGACVVVPQSQCPSTGTWFGNQACAPGFCPTTPLFGACCLNQTCIQASSCDCIFKGGVWFGPNGVCIPAQCANLQTGACCDPSNQQCSILAGPVCNQIGGLFAPGTTCAPGGGFNCQGLPSQPAPACCCCNSCHDLLPAACAIAGGVSQLGSNCQNFSCVTTGGACCDPTTGICTNVSGATACPAPSQFYLNQTCAQIQAQGLCPTINPGKCCDLSTGSCFATVQAQCLPNLFLWIPSGVCTPTAPGSSSGSACRACPARATLCAVIRSVGRARRFRRQAARRGGRSFPVRRVCRTRARRLARAAFRARRSARRRRRRPAKVSGWVRARPASPTSASVRAAIRQRGCARRCSHRRRARRERCRSLVRPVTPTRARWSAAIRTRATARCSPRLAARRAGRRLQARATRTRAASCAATRRRACASATLVRARRASSWRRA
jgi:hypothetical protein